MDRANEGVVEGALDLGAIGPAVDFAKRLQRDDALGHRTMATTNAQSFDDGFDDLPGGSNISNVANREDEIAAYCADRHRPFRSLGLKRHVGDLWDDVFADPA